MALFKYYNFFVSSFASALSQLGFVTNPWILNIILPLGISFYTFHGLSYIIDIYKGRIKAENNFIDYAVFVSFFPLLIAGPIERATHLLPQIKSQRTFNYASSANGLKQILWGLFKKIVIADQCSEFANTIFNNSTIYPGSTLLIGALFFTMQIYCDFSGYTDIAIGTSKLFGIDLIRNFAFPYFSRDIAEFWRRWHISLSSWFRDYLYIPLGGSHGGMLKKIRNTFIIFIVSGFWHGANWTFIAWGFLNALYILPSIIFGTNRTNIDIVASGKYFPSIKELYSMLLTFSLTVFAWIFFRSVNISSAINYISIIFSKSFFIAPYIIDDRTIKPFFPKTISLLVIIFMLVEWIGREQTFAIEKIGWNWPKVSRWSMYYLIIIMIYTLAGSKQQFIYFQF